MKYEELKSRKKQTGSENIHTYIHTCFLKETFTLQM